MCTAHAHEQVAISACLVQQSCVPGAEVQDADGKVLVKTDGSASSGATAQQGTLMPARTEVAAPVKSHPRVAMWCA